VTANDLALAAIIGLGIGGLAGFWISAAVTARKIEGLTAAIYWLSRPR
jgi:hypothetical protein